MNAMNAASPAPSIVGDLVDATLRDGKTIRLSISTRSMFPTFAPGDHIIARRAEPRIGAIALLRSGSQRLAHRLIARQCVAGKIFWLTQGDNCADAEALWSSDAICAMIIAVEKNGRVANLESGRARVLGGGIALLSRMQSWVGRSHRGIQIILGTLRRAGVVIAQWIIEL